MSIQDILKDKEKIRLISEAAFNVLDFSKNGLLEKTEIELHLSNLAKDLNLRKPTKEEMENLMKEIDVNKDGKIDVEDFDSLVENLLEDMHEATEA